MDNRQSLEKHAQVFTREDLTQFFRAASGKFKPEKADYSHYLISATEVATAVKDLQRLGRVDFEDSRRLVVLAGEVDKELTSQSGKLKQYDVAKQVLKAENLDAGIFVFHDSAGHFRFSWITAQYSGTRREFSSFRRYTYFVSPDASARTFVEQIGRADFSSVEKITEAFSVEPVTTEFFRKYREIFEEVEATIKLKWTDEKKRLYAQRFFNRVMFFAILERKGWLNFNGRKDYMKALFADYHNNEKEKNANFHRSRLNALFFRGLNNPRGDERSNPEFRELSRHIGDVPYLNGGLFDQEADDEEHFFPAAVAVKILGELIYQFNFTVTEFTPLDIEVAVDPEMLGRIFEELMTGRHESGSYYTPKPVVAFMCREALKGYLKTSLPAESDEGLAAFVDKNDAADLKNPLGALDDLRVVKVCDTACGSGAYLLGMLHELLDQLPVLFAQHQKDAPTTYCNKLDIIQNNLYGVDLHPFAVNIARLRLWLSLIVDYGGDNPPPLPNLDIKIEPGDSLTAPDPSGGLNLATQLVDNFLIAKNDYGTSHHSEKKVLREKANGLRDQIKMWAGRSKDFKGFDWVIEFAELFVPDKKIGFDIILANPPYVRADAQFKHIEDENERQEQISEWHTFRKQTKDYKTYKTLHEKWDLYIPFLESAYQLLRQKGQMIFIVPDAFNTAKYASNAHDFFLQNTSVERIDFCSEINLFNAGINNTILHFAKVAPANNHKPIRARRWGDNKEEFELNLEFHETMPQLEFGVNLFRYDSTISKGLGEDYVTLDTVCYMSKGMVIYTDERQHLGAFKTDDLISQVKDKIHSKAFIQGRDRKEGCHV